MYFLHGVGLGLNLDAELEHVLVCGLVSRKKYSEKYG